MGLAAELDIVIPSEYNGLHVTEIGENAFEGEIHITNITIPDGVTLIGSDAFRNCRSLTSVTIGNGVISIGGLAFYECSSLTSITFKGTVEEWEAIKKYSDWASDVPAVKVVCSNGEVAL